MARPYDDVPRLPDPPFDLGALAGEGPVEIEIGFGRADFLLERARVRPDLRLLGIETRLKWVGLAAQKVLARGLENVRVFAGDGRVLLAGLPSASVAAVYMHFPDPWWKKRHAKRRMLTPDAARDLGRVLAPGGTVFVQTDVSERALAYRTLLEGEPTLVNQGEAEGLTSSNPTGIRSHRERRCEEEGLPVYRLSFLRRAR